MADDLQRAIELAKSGQNGEAQELATTRLKQDPSHAHAWIVLAPLVGDRQESIVCLRQAIRLADDDQRSALGRIRALS